MKRALQIIVLCGLITISASSLFAQTFRFGLNGGLGAPFNNGNRDYKPGITLLGTAKIVILDDHLSLGIAFGFQRFGGGNSGVGLSSGPACFSLDYAIKTGKVEPYVGFDGGLFMNGGAGIGNGRYKGSIGITPVLGARIALSDRWGFDANLRFQWISVKDDDDYYAIILMAGLYYKLRL